MKKEIATLFLLAISISFVFAMEDPIFVKTNPGNYVKLYAWTSGGGPLYDMNQGKVDEQGMFNTTFFMVSEPTARLQILIIEGDEKGDVIQDVKFDNQDLSTALLIDCTSICKISKNTENLSTTQAVLTEQILVANETKVVSQNITSEKIDSTDNQTSSTNILAAGKSVFTKADGNVNVPVIVLIVLLASIIIYLMLVKRPKKKQHTDDFEEKELEQLEEKVKEKENEINMIKEERERKHKIEDTRRRLFEDEKKIKNFTGREDEDYIKLKKIEEARRRLANDEKTLSQLRGKNPKAEERQNMRDNPAVKGFLDNMKKYSGDRKN